jgi:hypothetical protein
VVYGGALEYIARGSGFHYFLQELLLPKTDQGYDLNPGMALAKGPGRGNAVHLGHDEVHQHHVGLDPVTHLDRFLAICPRTYQDQIFKSFEQDSQSIADQVVVVHYDHPNARI